MSLAIIARHHAAVISIPQAYIYCDICDCLTQVEQRTRFKCLNLPGERIETLSLAAVNHLALETLEFTVTPGPISLLNPQMRLATAHWFRNIMKWARCSKANTCLLCSHL